MSTVYVLNKDGKPLMPTTRGGHVRHLLKEQKARVVRAKPFTIQLLYETDDAVQPLYLGIDPGRTNIGIAVVKANGTAVFTAHLETRNKKIPKLMQDRKKARRARRTNGRRHHRQRRAKANDTISKKCVKQDTAQSKNPSKRAKKIGVIKRHLPGCKKDVLCIGIKNKEAKYTNRARPEGWLTPTANQLLQTHINLVKKIQKFLPISDVVLEANKFAFMRLDNPDIQKWQYQQGPLYQKGSLKNAVSEMQEHHCLFCKKPIEHYHHVVPQSENGSNTIANIVGLCAEHHNLVHKDIAWQGKLAEEKTGLNKKYSALSVLNQIIPALTKELSALFPKHFFVTNGKSTYDYRAAHGVSKDHWLDAYCIACGLVPGIDKLAERKLQLTLSVSLHAPDNVTRSSMMPVNDAFPLEKLIPACRRYQKTTGRRISFEYSMVNGVNDSPQMAKKLADLIRGMGAHVNLIPINPVDGSPYSATDEANVRRFQKMLEDLGVNATIRRRLGTDISAACGQLRREDAKQAEQATRQTTSERTNAQ